MMKMIINIIIDVYKLKPLLGEQSPACLSSVELMGPLRSPRLIKGCFK